ncbi:MAG: DUF4255 domain-containing protein [Anaerolineales bacterium]|nr:DUF4255 domain-containing protein [Anaerolineales bacterium]MCB9128398.1 DUF4255 domain-containing protein [Ardenticatenales bacterium]
MTAELPIASVTAILKNILENELVRRMVSSTVGTDVIVSALPPDRITVGADERTQLNLFFYQAKPNMRLHAPDWESRNETPGSRPLTLELHYLVTAYSAQELHAEVLLSHALRIFQETSTLNQDAFEKRLAAIVRGNERKGELLSSPTDRSSRVEQITIRPQFLPTEEMSRLWSALQAPFRPSVAYKVTVVTNDD